jgi:hypothetical protein
VVTSAVQGQLYQTLLDVMGDRSLRFSEILADQRVAGVAQDDVARAVDAGVAMGLFDISTGLVRKHAGSGSGSVSVPAAFSRGLLAQESLSGRPLALASDMTGTGHSVGDLDAAILHELVEGGAEGLAGRVDARL